jgi:phosphoesterase RecJ-like protein
MSKRIPARARKRAAQLIQSSRDVFVGTHVRPDGDALGSLLAVALAVEAMGGRAARLCADPVPLQYQFLPTAELISAQPPAWTPQLGIVVDCDGLARVGSLEPAFAGLPHLVDIDHHGSGPPFGEVRLLDPTAGASGEIVWDLLRSLKVQPDARIATCLYAAILTDTGRFGYGNTTSTSLRIAARLVGAGADPHQIARKIYEERSLAGSHLLGVALSRLQSELDAEVVSAALMRADFDETGAARADTEGIIDHLRAIGGPRLAVLFVEVENDRVRVSLRSDGSVDVSEIALNFGGGGHTMAAGCTVQGTVEEARDRVLKAALVALGAQSSPDAA